MASKSNRRGRARRKSAPARPADQPRLRARPAPAPRHTSDIEVTPDAPPDGIGDAFELRVETDVLPDEAELRQRPAGASSALRAARLRAARRPAATITRDYSYVRGELVRIAVLSAVLFGSIGVLTLFWD